MEFSEVVRRRRMVRRYADRPVDAQLVDRMLEHAIRAPSAGFSQGWAFLRLDTPDDVRRFWSSTTPAPEPATERAGSRRSTWLDGMMTAPVVIVPLTSKDAYLERYAQPDKGWTDRAEDRWPVPYWFVDAGMAALLILQTATDLGLGACFFGIPGSRIEAFRTEFHIPGEYRPVGAITVGHRLPDDTGSAGSTGRRSRRGTDQVVHRGDWSG